jgi:hypothetical protein
MSSVIGKCPGGVSVELYMYKVILERLYVLVWVEIRRWYMYSSDKALYLHPKSVCQALCLTPGMFTGQAPVDLQCSSKTLIMP